MSAPDLTDLAVIYEHPEWFEPLFAALDRHGVSYVKVPLAGHVFDPSGSPAAARVVFSAWPCRRFCESQNIRSSMPEPVRALAGAGDAGRECLGLNIDTSKARQMSLIARLGLKGPATRVAHRQADIPKAAEGLRFPVLVKADIGGAGAGITRYETTESLAEAAGEKWCPVGVNGISLVQEYAPRRGGKITRVETLGGKYLYAIDIESPGDAFDLCPADACLVRPGAPTLTMTKTTPPDEIIAAVERLAVAGEIEVGGVEYLIDDRDGSVLFYDINGLSNFVANPVQVLGFDPHDTLVDWLKCIVAQEKAKQA